MEMASINENERQIEALWKKIDEIVEKLTAEEKQATIDAAVEAALKEEKDKQLAKKDKFLKLIWIPITILILSNIFAWIFDFLPGGR